jgi:hypothetical protein
MTNARPLKGTGAETMPGRPSDGTALRGQSPDATPDDAALFYVRGPGPPPATVGPADAHAPAWWVEDAERLVLALVDVGHTVSSDDLHAQFPNEPSASGAAFGALFARLARQGKLREVGTVRSRRPEARRRRIILWGRP